MSNTLLYHKPLTFVIITMLVATLVSSPIVTSYVFAVPAHSKMGTGRCNGFASNGVAYETCCWRDNNTGTIYSPVTSTCQTCKVGAEGNYYDCQQPEIQFFQTGGVFQSQPSGPAIPPGGGVLETEPTAPSGPVVPPGNVGTFEEQAAPGDTGSTPNSGGIFNTPQTGGVFNALPPTTEEEEISEPPATTEPATAVEDPQVPVCEEGLEFNDDLGFCVPTECPEGQELNEETGICVLEEQPAEQQEQTAEEPEEEQPSEESDSQSDSDGTHN